MGSSKKHKIIIKFLNREANYKELEKLNTWLKNAKNVPIFNHFVQTEYIIALCMAEYNLKKAKKSIETKIKNSEKKQKVTLYKRMTVAATVLLIIGVSMFRLNNDHKISLSGNTNIIEIGSNKAILTLENGDQVALEKGKSFQAETISANGEKIIYSSRNKSDKAKEKLQFNYLTIPRGGQFFVQLSDGTEVWLNSDSKLKYPVKFIKGEIREIELVYGEAYLKVSPSENHDGVSFNVRTKAQTINVLGTEFNIKAYNDDDEIATTLVEGKVAIKKGKIEKILRPNQQSRIVQNLDRIEVMDVDVSQEISWIDGMFTFNEESLGEMMKVISRWYDVEVVFESAKRKNFVFTGVLERTKSFTDILKLIETTSEGEVEFEINRKTIIIR
ncbi:FecR family protein [Flavivirga abyssicola]|uniref:FecR family protein n=1 Tax=Flavivirga abyssicola TaxID=3063533 RepID=UPI0026DF7B18|nr:FecR family protein [Flavivirga sp. MEBiC07777]WVK12567.1 FecR family protein [Flavivirga sp. MEBiC07777]